MRFSTIIVGTLAAFGLVAAQATPTQQIVQAFKEITTLSDNLRIETQKINIVNAPLQGYKIAQGFTAIITRVAQASTMLSGGSSAKTRRQMAALGDADAQLVVQALTTVSYSILILIWIKNSNSEEIQFVQVHQALLNVVIGKHGLLTLIPFFEPIRQALVSLEATVDVSFPILSNYYIDNILTSA